ncbi:MAG TPA: ion channel [Longimicrobiaceae bacterium]|nr:ion channel [Longimicrobiaceae bacterium]
MFRSGRAVRPVHPHRRPTLGIAWLVLGIALLLLVFLDALWTTLWVDGGAGPLASRLTTWAWRGVLAVVGRRRHGALSLFGPTIIVTVVVTWVLMVWAGWVFVFASDPGWLVTGNEPQVPAGWAGRIWFVAYAMSTMGNGDIVPNGGVAQIAASLTTLSGFFLATLVISYLLAVLGAVVAKRAFAGQVSGLGKTAEEFLTSAWDGESFRTLDLPLNSFSGLLGALTEQYLSFPVLQYYHGARPAKSPAVGIVVLDEALTILRYGVPEPYRPNAAVLHGARAGVRSYLETLKSAFIDPADEAPPPPDLGRLREAGIPTVSDAEFAGALDDLRDRRRELLGLLRNDGWDWSDR